ncbi:MAG: hypothetical protein M3066_13350 [Actinomycetota bacterium]|nr:hypothetical protein [Actinomycetota bacterium]
MGRRPGRRDRGRPDLGGVASRPERHPGDHGRSRLRPGLIPGLSRPAPPLLSGGNWQRTGRRTTRLRRIDVSSPPAEAPAAASVQARLDARTRPEPADAYPVAVLSRLEASGRFHRDTGFGRIFHPGSVSFRENRATDGLHVVINNDHIAAHVDRVTPLAVNGDKPGRYSLRQAAAHNIAGAAQDFIRLLRGRQGDHRSELDCEWVWDPDASNPDPAHLLDPGSSDWSVQLEARVSGVLDDERLRAAVAVAVGRRPPEHAVVDIVDAPDDTALGAARVRLHSRPVAVSRWPPLRATLAHHPDGDVVMLNLNHAAGDGPAALAVLRTIAAAYRGGDPGREQPDFVAVSDLPIRPASAPVSTLVARYRHLVELARDRLANPARLAADQPVDHPGAGFHLVRLTVDETRRVINASRPGTGRNLLLAGLHLAIGHWNLQHGTPGRRIGVLLPVDLRPDGWPEETVGNFSVTARVSTSRRHRSGPRAALQAVRTQKTRNKRVRTGVALIGALERSGLLPLWAKQSLVVLQPLTRNRLVDTALFSDLGWIDEPPSFGGGVDVGDVWFSTPARTPGCLCIGAVTVAGRLHLTFRYPLRLFSADAVQRFADCYLAQIRQVAESRY